MNDDKTTFQLLEYVVRGLLNNMLLNIDKGNEVDPDLLKEVRECIQAIYH